MSTKKFQHHEQKNGPDQAKNQSDQQEQRRKQAQERESNIETLPDVAVSPIPAALGTVLTPDLGTVLAPNLDVTDLNVGYDNNNEHKHDQPHDQSPEYKQAAPVPTLSTQGFKRRKQKICGHHDINQHVTDHHGEKHNQDHEQHSENTKKPSSV